MLPLPVLATFGDPDVRKAAVAGSFYPSGASALRSMVRRYLDGARPDWPGVPRALIVPHAGLIYSGWVAACAYALLRGHPFGTVVMVGPSHHHVVFGGFPIVAHGAFETPLGRVPIDAAVADALIKTSESFSHRPESHRHEHCLEVQLPFLQEVLGDFSIVPVLMTSQSFPRCQELAEGLAKVWNEKTLLVASTDLSHYYPKDVAARLDGRAEQYIENMDAEGLGTALERGETEMCGGGPAVAVLLAARKAGCKHAHVLKRADSSDSPDGHAPASDVVGYLSAAIA